MTLEETRQYLEKILEKANDSPLLQDEGAPEVRSIKEEITLLLGKLKQPLRIAVIGEVKSGKSTLINAFAGGQIAPTNVTEATACLMVVEYSEDRGGEICWKDGTSKKGTIEDIYELLRANENDQTFFRNVDIVKIRTPLQGLRDVTIVDTPGLATITEQNALVTRDHFQHIDVVLWVLNANYLGQSDINEEIRIVAKMGKPVIAVVNRIDEIDGDVNDLIEYVDGTLGIYLKSVKALSGKNAYDAVTRGDEAGRKASGFDGLFTYIMENIERRSDDVKLESITRSALTLEKKLDFTHLEAEKGAALLISTYDDIGNNILAAKNNVFNQAVSDASYWVNNSFLSDATRILYEKIDSAGIFPSGSDAAIQEEIKRVVSNSAEGELKTYFGTLQQKILQEWEKELENVNTRTRSLFQQASLTRVEDYKRIMGPGVLPGEEGGGEITDTIITAGAIGGTLAVYAATLGPSAAYITIGTALGSFLPPVLVTGAVVGGIRKFIQNKQTKQKRFAAVNNMVAGIRLDVNEKIRDAITQYCNELHDVTLQQTKEDFLQNSLGGHSMEAFEAFHQSLVRYNQKYSIL